MCLVCLLLCREEGSSSVLITERRGIGLYEVPLSVSLFGFEIVYVSQLPCVRYYVFVKSSFKHTREECESKRAYVFRCLMFNLSGLVNCNFFYGLLDLRSGECCILVCFVLLCQWICLVCVLRV